MDSENAVVSAGLALRIYNAPRRGEAANGPCSASWNRSGYASRTKVVWECWSVVEESRRKLLGFVSRKYRHAKGISEVAGGGRVY